MNKLTTKNKLKALIIIAFLVVMVAYFVLVMAVMSADAAIDQHRIQIWLPNVSQNRCMEASCQDDPRPWPGDER